MIEGWYYLHTNGSLIYKRELGGTAADIRESTFAVAMWPCDSTNRENAWDVLVEALSLKKANKDRIFELAEKWGCNDEDAQEYAKRIKCRLLKDENMWCAVREDFLDVPTSPSGFGKTCLEAMASLCYALGYRASKMWGHNFKNLLNK